MFLILWGGYGMKNFKASHVSSNASDSKTMQSTRSASSYKGVGALVAVLAAIALVFAAAMPASAYANPLTDAWNGFVSFISGDPQSQEVDSQAEDKDLNAERVADTSTTHSYTLGNNDSTQYNGRVWVDKSVSKEDSVSFGDGLDVANNSDFLVTYSALATSTAVQGGAPVDVVFVLDLSASMCWGVNSNLVDNKENSRIKAMVDALNTNIAALAASNQENRIGVAVFNGTGNVLMPLTAVKDFSDKVTDGQYFTLQSFSGAEGAEDGQATVLCNMNGEPANTAGGTNIQAGLYQGMKLLANEQNTTYTDSNGTQVTRIPNVVVMSDGAPTTFASAGDSSYQTGNSHEWTYPEGPITNKTNIGDTTDKVTVQSGSWWNDLGDGETVTQIGGGDNYRAHSADGFMALATASYMKNAISANYYGDGWGTSAENTANVYTIGFSTDIQTDSMSTMANVVLNPGQNLNESLATVDNDSPCDREFATLWQAYQDYIDDQDATVNGHIGTVGNSNKVPTDGFNGWDPNTADENNSGWNDGWDWNDMHLREYIVQHPTGDAAAYDPKSFDYPTQYFAASDSQGLIDAFEQIAGLITDQAKAPTEVTGNPVSDGYITYTDTTGQYMEIKDVTTMIYQGEKLENPAKGTDAEGNATYTFTHEFTNPAYPGQTHNTSEIQITVKNNGDHTQTVEVKIPASAIPLRTNNVTLDGSGNPTSNEPSDTMPMRLCYEVGLEEDVNGAALAGVDETYLSSNIENGVVSFYSNKYQKDSTEADEGVGATVTFEPSPDNPFYFVQEDTPLWIADSQNENGTLVGGKVAKGDFDPSATYYVPVTYYNGTSKIETYVARSGETLRGFVDSDANGLYIKAGSPRIGNLQDVTASKQNNETVTYGNYREPTFVYDGNQADPQQGHFLVLLGNNGKLSVPVSNLTIAKKVTADEGLTVPAGKAFTFQLTIPSKANAEGVLAVLHTEGADDQDVTLQFDESGVAKIANADGTTGDIQLEANQSLEVKGVGTTAYTVVEENATNNSGFSLTNVEGAQGDNAQNSVENATASGTVQAGGSTVTFTNNYSVTPTTTTDLNIDLGGTKTITNRDFQPGDAFSFTIEAAQATPNAPLPYDADGDGSADTTVTINPTSGNSASFSFGKITFDKPGEYRYTIREVDYDTDNNDATVNPGGIDYDAAIYRVNIVIVDNGDGTLRLATTDEIKNTETQGDLQYTSNPMVQVNKGADSSMTGVDGNAVTFNNVYNPEAATASIQLQKVLKGKAWNGDEFTFQITAGEATAPDGSTIDEVPMPDQTEVTVNQKTDTNDDGNDFANFTFGPITYDQAGTYTYTVTEVAPQPGDDSFNTGMDYSENKATVTVQVTDNKHGGFTAAATVSNGTFTNKYASSLDFGAQGQGGLWIHKSLTNHNIADGQFEFTVTAADQASADKAGITDGLTKVVKSTSGKVEATDDGQQVAMSAAEIFSDAKFTQDDADDTYTYTVQETKGGDEAAGYTNDKTVYTVTITTTDDGQGGIKVSTHVQGDDFDKTYVYDNDDSTTDEQAVVPFNNGYEATGTLGGNGSTSINATKTLTNRPMTAGEFTFNVTDANGKQVATGTNDASGNVTFDAISYEKA